jgi:hypothetical protein
MSKTVRRLLFWTPRILCILFACFLSLFALDVFGGRDPWWHQILGFLIHLIPVYLLVAVLLLSWRWEWIGGILFPVLGLLHFSLMWSRWPWPRSLIMTLPIGGTTFLLGGLFLAGWFLRAKVRRSS